MKYIKTVELSIDAIKDTLCRSNLYIGLENVFSGKVLSGREWIDFFEPYGCHDSRDFNHIINLYHEINDVITSPSAKYVKSISISYESFMYLEFFK